jgi:glycosyltransferase involved in cell wall biosynthesis
MRTSVIIASYNYGHLIGEAIRSVQEQTVDDLEILVVDDGSTDDTQDVLAAIDDPRLRVQRIDNSGVSVARNTALEIARGEFIAFLDADDRWLPTKLERQLALFESEPEVGLVFADFKRFDGDFYYRATMFDFIPDLPDLPSRPSRDGGGRVITADTFQSLVRLSHFAAWPIVAMVRAERVRGIRFPPGVRLCEDMHYMIRVYPRVAAAGYIAEPLAEVRRHGENSYASLAEIGEAAVQALRNASEEPLRPEYRDALRRRIGLMLVSLAYTHYHLRNARAAAWAALRALRLPGSRGAALRRLAMIPALPLIADPANVDWTEKAEADGG